MEIVAFYIGPGTETSAKIILEKLGKIRIKYICNDGNFAYQNIIPKGTQHIISKAETCLVESFNASLRHYIACLRRRTMCYSKSRKNLNRDVFFWLNGYRLMIRYL